MGPRRASRDGVLSFACERHAVRDAIPAGPARRAPHRLGWRRRSHAVAAAGGRPGRHPTFPRTEARMRSLLRSLAPVCLLAPALALASPFSEFRIPPHSWHALTASLNSDLSSSRRNFRGG